ncbi:dephospho-CoA kinase [Corynebacterium phocae]|uniref:Dephospho-CoA kinase n=1 Tax=Corynebacterium phocae TaxID=161895 RepID=A0A1L7D3C8_9CORY|nr:dephospho-CoA kinase [Corynebacterium phocae]APT92605.1 dephospho-CoA kinase [Corynebacterium phocae]KAA8724161.1 dephospho-CoA kinase [Corynebacterium phocae]
MKLIGLTGGIGSGKSTVAQLLASHGWEVVDADKIAREIVEPGQPALEELAAEFGQDILDCSGQLDRAVLAERAFATQESTSRLNAITHPRIAEITQQRFAAARAGGKKFCVYDMPLLVDKGQHKDMDEVIVVDVEPEERVRRLVASRGLKEADARARIGRQIPDSERLAAATFVIDNNGPRDALEAQVARVVKQIEAA